MGYSSPAKVSGTSFTRALSSMLAISMLVAFGGCGLPRDPEGTLERVSGGTLRVGVAGHEPWVVLEGSEPTGIGSEIVKLLADEINAVIEWL